MTKVWQWGKTGFPPLSNLRHSNPIPMDWTLGVIETWLVIWRAKCVGITTSTKKKFATKNQKPKKLQIIFGVLHLLSPMIRLVPATQAKKKERYWHPSHTITGYHLIIHIPISQSTINIQIHAPQNNIHCGSASEPCTSGLPFYCCSTPPVCVPVVIGALAVWWYNNKKNKKKHSYVFLKSAVWRYAEGRTLTLGCLPTCVCVCPQVQGPLRECCSIRSGFCGLPS